MSRTKTVAGPFITRRRARAHERCVQNALRAGGSPDRGDGTQMVCGVLVPIWATGVRVEKAGLFQYTLVATEKAGH